MRPRSTCHIENQVQLIPNGVVPTLKRMLGEILHYGFTCVIKEDIDPAQLMRTPVDPFCSSSWIAQIHRFPLRFIASGSKRCGARFCSTRLDVASHDTRSHGQENTLNHLALAAACASDENALAFQQVGALLHADYSFLIV